MFNHVSTSDLVYHIKLVFKLIHYGMADFMLLDYDIYPHKMTLLLQIKINEPTKETNKKAHKSS